MRYLFLVTVLIGGCDQVDFPRMRSIEAEIVASNCEERTSWNNGTTWDLCVSYWLRKISERPVIGKIEGFSIGNIPEGKKVAIDVKFVDENSK